MTLILVKMLSCHSYGSNSCGLFTPSEFLEYVESGLDAGRRHTASQAAVECAQWCAWNVAVVVDASRRIHGDEELSSFVGRMGQALPGHTLLGTFACTVDLFHQTRQSIT
eukprot:TRINITY_DN6447_c0_g1_i1.p2 TRINITY_DN6447_c0_g1~~TRINITY_DN6447_c0_g1_i1.p2  ORF type:complete len:110 (+),score=16.03 TRINITY_DN6447_c0_g1_i1:365-694(+)